MERLQAPQPQITTIGSYTPPAEQKPVETNTGAKLPRMRTRDQAMAQLRQDDPNTATTRFALERLIKSGELPYIKVGNKILINYDLFLEYLRTGAAVKSETVEISDSYSGTIRRVSI